MKWFIDHLAPNGRAGVIVPHGVLFNTTSASTTLREALLRECNLEALISFPRGVFRPYSGVATAALIFSKPAAMVNTYSTTSVWFYELTADGYTLDDKRTPIEINDIPDVLSKWPNREEGRNSYLVPLEKIQEKDWSLATGRHTPSARHPLQSESAKKDGFDSASLSLGEILEPAPTTKIGPDQSAPVMSITMEYGLIDQSEKFKKRVASTDISEYKKVFRNELVVGFPIDEGVLGFQTKYAHAAVSPAYGVWRLKRTDVRIQYLELVLRSLAMRKVYRAKMQGAVDRRRSIPKDDFLSIRVPIPSEEIQESIISKWQAIEQARSRMEQLDKEIQEEIGSLLQSFSK